MQATLTCGSPIPGPDTSVTTANFLSIRMEIKSLQGNDDFNFKIVITAFKDIFAGSYLLLKLAYSH